MGWEYRGNNGPYYTRSRKIAGRVKREYIGGGTVGEMAAVEDAEIFCQHRTRDGADRKLIAQIEDAERSLIDFSKSVDVLMRAALYASGYHQHKRGEWRHKRDK